MSRKPKRFEQSYFDARFAALERYPDGALIQGGWVNRKSSSVTYFISKFLEKKWKIIKKHHISKTIRAVLLELDL